MSSSQHLLPAEEVEWQEPTYAQMQEFHVRQCGWCMEWRHVDELEEIVLREPRAEKEGTGKSQMKMTAAWEGNVRQRQCCYRCLDRLECAAASGIRGT